MTKIIYDQNLHTDAPTLLLKGRDFSNIGSVIATGIVYKNNFNSANELSFKVYKSTDGITNCLWDEINDYNIIYIPEYEECFDIQVALTEDAGTYKTVTCTSLAETELSQINLYDMEINTESDMMREEYDPDLPTIFYRSSDKSASLLHRILEKAPHYEIGYVSKTLKELKTFYEFSISETNIYDELMGEIAQQYQCLFTFDIRPDGTRLVNAYDLCNTCSECGYRGDFHDKCPECGSTAFVGAYGKDTTIYISRDNLAATASIESNKGELKNCFHVSGGDELITATVANCNPNGSNYFWSFPPEILENMPADLSNRITKYNEKYQACISSEIFYLQEAHVKKYNAVINYVTSKFPDAPYGKISSKITGYRNVSQLLYDVIDLERYLDSSMMPTPSIDGQTMENAIELITANLCRIAVSDPSRSAESVINNAIICMAKAYINTALYKVSIENDDYQYEPALNKYSEGSWTGQITLTDIADNTQVKKTPVITISVDANEERYLQQKLNIAMTKSDNAIKDITSMEMTYDEFCERITYYSIHYLHNAKIAYDDCISVIRDSENPELSDKMKDAYLKRSAKLSEQISYMENLSQSADTLYGDLSAIQEKVKSDLDFESWIGEDLWHVFCSYRREDSYKNDYYKSDGMSNLELIEQANKLIEAAKKELYKASHLQYNISASLNNLLALKEFAPFTDNFSCGNWIHMMVDDTLYHLRLLSYEINFDDLTSLPVEFSTTEKTWSGISDVDSILKSVGSFASSYSSIKQQMAKNADDSKQINAWLNEGINAATTKLVNDSMTQEIVIDSHGILCRAYDDIEAGYDDCQIRINRNALYLTTDNWKSIHSAIGKYYYTVPSNHASNHQEIKSAYGILAETIVGKFILGEALNITNENGSLSFDENGLMITNHHNTITINPNQEQLIKISRGSQDVLYVDENGNMNMSGIINATGGTIGGFTVGDSALYCNTSSFAGNDNSVYLGADGISCGTAFKVSSDGKVKLDSFSSALEIRNPECAYEEYMEFTPLLISGHGRTRSPYTQGHSYEYYYIGHYTYYENVNNAYFTTGQLKLRGESIVDGSIAETTINADSAYFGGSIFSGNQIVTTSDRNQKHNIQPISEIYEKIYLETPTYSFLFNNGDRRHFGTISQEIEELLDKYQVSPLDFAPFCKDIRTKEIINENGGRESVPDLDEEGNEQYIYSMRYGEYTMLTVHMVQKLYKENEQLKQTIADFGKRVEKLENPLTLQQN